MLINILVHVCSINLLYAYKIWWDIIFILLLFLKLLFRDNCRITIRLLTLMLIQVPSISITKGFLMCPFYRFLPFPASSLSPT